MTLSYDKFIEDMSNLDLFKDEAFVKPQLPFKFAILQPFEPVKIHKRKKWMRQSYHERIQKKWRKRYGLKYPDYFIKENKVIVHQPSNTVYLMPAQYAELKRVNNLSDYSFSQLWRPSPLAML
jgi:hypothetical protein